MAANLFVPRAIDAIPHWARVAFAARCARQVLPLFRQAWLDAEDRHSTALEKAIGLAEQSAAAAAAEQGLNEAVVGPIMAAGASLRRVLGVPLQSASAPPDEETAYIASFTA